MRWWKYKSHILEPRHDEIAVKDATSAVAKRKLKKIQDCRDSNSYLYDTSRYRGGEGGGGGTLTNWAAKPFEAAHEITITDKT